MDNDKKKPLIGVAPNLEQMGGQSLYTLRQVYVSPIIQHGGLPLILPFTEEIDTIRQTVSMLDGVYFSGGCDVTPSCYQEEPVPGLEKMDPERDAYEMALYRIAADMNIPILGICRGMQLINIAAGGSLYQDIYSQAAGVGGHTGRDVPRWAPYHEVTLAEESMLYTLFKQKTLKVNSFHHQAVKEIAPDFRVTAVAADGIIEAMENTRLRYGLCVQWHPEDMYQRLPAFGEIFRSFVTAARGAKGRSRD